MRSVFSYHLTVTPCCWHAVVSADTHVHMGVWSCASEREHMSYSQCLRNARQSSTPRHLAKISSCPTHPHISTAASLNCERVLHGLYSRLTYETGTTGGLGRRSGPSWGG